jgi:Dopa 4,5-dioxygenase family
MRTNPAPASDVRSPDPDVIRHYHAHVYYDPATTRERAARLRERVAATFPQATLGRWHDELVGRICNRCIRSPSRRRCWLRSCRG